MNFAVRPVLIALQLVVTVGGLSSAAAPARAMSVSPTQVEMNSVGQRARAQVIVTNDNATAMPVELTIERLMLDERGANRTVASGDNFLIFPPQALLPPGGSQVFRLQWVGEPQIAQSESFMVTVNQIPVRLPKGKSAVQIVMAMGVMVNVAPTDGTPALRVVETTIATDKSGVRRPTITVENPTKVHALLPDTKIVLSNGSWSRTLERNEIGTNIGIGLVQPGKRRRFVLPVDLPQNVATVKASVEYKTAK